MSKALQRRLDELEWTVELERQLDEMESYVEDTGPYCEVVDDLHSIETVNYSDSTTTLDL